MVHSSIRKLSAMALLCLMAAGYCSLQAQMVTNYPVEAPGAFKNPLKGFRNDLGFSQSQYPYPTVVRKYIPWNAIENNTNDTVQKIRDYCNSQWANLPTNNLKVIPRVYIDWDSNSGNECWPADLTTGDWTSQAFKDRVVRLVGRLGEVWDDDPRVAWVQTGIIGYWGEQESPVGISQDGWAQRLGNAFTNAFKNKKLVVRNMDQWPGYVMGSYWDSFGHPSQSNVRTTINNLNNQGRYLTQVEEGETAYNWGTNTFYPLYGGSPTITLGNTNYTDNMIDVIRELHTSALGWIAGYKTDGTDGTDPNVVKANAARMQDAFGYHFSLTEFACSARTEPGANVDMRFKVKNKGSTPFYENWPLALVLINETSRQIVWKATLPNVDIRTWLPGSNYNASSHSYLTPAPEYQVAASVPMPAGMAAGQYLIGLSILEPNSRTPGVFFAVTNFFKQSQSQPLARIGIGTDVSSSTLMGVLFDNLLTDDKRYYTTNQVGPNYTLTLQTSEQGTITTTPGGTNQVKDTGVQVTVIANPGYVFTYWGGALAGLTNNPAIVVMDTNKTISANYIQLSAAAILTTSGTNGSISLNPPGGVYSTGTVVSVTAIANIGYAFASWGGDLAGLTTNPATILMDTNKTISANYVSVPTCTLTTSAIHGDITLNPPGGVYNTGTVVTVTAVPGSDYLFWSWSGDLSGSVNPTNILVDANKSVTANFRLAPNVAALTSWTSGTTNNKVSGSNRLMTVMVMGESSGSFSATGVTYGGQSMTKQTEKLYYVSGNRTYAAIFTLNETGVNTATNGTIAVTWSTTPSSGTSVYSVLLGNVDQTTPVSATASNGLTGTTITTSALAAGNGDMIIAAGATESDGSITFTNGFTEAFETSGLSWGDACGGYKMGIAASETPGYTQSASMRLVLCAMAVKMAASGFSLTTSASNGSVILNPPGGVYTNGQVVTVTAAPDSGYAFGSWSGDLSGSVNPTNITMNADKCVTANFAVTAAPTSFRVNCGGSNYVAGDGTVFEADRNYDNSSNSTFSTVSAISGTTDGPLYQTERWGSSFSYNIPLVNGIYAVTLMFAEINFNAANSRVFNVAIEGSQVITNLDIWAKVGKNAAYNVTNVVTVSDGQLNIAFAPVVQNPKISAIKVERVAGQTINLLPPVLQGGQLRLEWVGGGTLQTSTNVLGTWNDVPGAASPCLTPATNSAQFFRVKQ
jgi:hypothetical protein